MRSTLLLLVLASCTAPARTEEAEDPSSLVALLGSPDALRREEAAQRMGRAGLTAPVNADTEGIRAGLLQALRERSPERLVWRAWHALRRGCLGRLWSGVAEALGRQGYRFTEMYEPREEVRFVRFAGAEAAY
ncbi:MAG TPA: hypothetical protein VEN81_01480, partial [Planctomycetota bacterium]|nr:hypothetical protein [Planctomycetota bacterium]